MTDKYINKQIVYIDSHSRNVGETHNNFTSTINLTKPADTVCVLRATIKKSYYLVQAGQNTFTLKEGTNIVTIVIDEGNYSATSFKTIITTLLNTNSPNSWTYTCILPNPLTQPATGKFTFTVTGNGGIQPAFIFTTYLNELFGFEPNTTNNFNSNSLTSSNMVNFQLKDTLRIHSNIVTDEPNNILQEITASTTADFSSIRYECFDIEANSKSFNIKTNRFHFTILDEDAQPINLSLNVLITLLFYQKNTIADIANNTNINYIKYNMLNPKK